MEIYDTLSTKKISIDYPTIRIYLCGVTVYDDAHIGHARTIIVFDVLRRFFESIGKKIVFIQNFTDVDDKIINRATREGKSSKQVSERFIENYFRDFDKINVKRATTYPKATEYIDEMISFISKLIKDGVAYVSKNGVYFSVSKFPQYGKLSKKNIEDLQSGTRIEIDEYKKDPLDFALWKFSESEPFWESPWGNGRPGWHIECSAMSTKLLGENFEIHGGGRDLIFPHHENEIAQSEAFTGKQFAKTWMHVGMVTINGEKMSKSLGNIKSVSQTVENWGPNVLRLFCLSGHYSKPIDYSEDLLRENLVKWRQVESAYFEMIHAEDRKNDRSCDISEKSSLEEFNQSLENDFNTHEALLAFFRLVKDINKTAAEEVLTKEEATRIMPIFQKMINVLGLKLLEISEDKINAVNDMIKKRENLRKAKNFHEADKIRDQLNEMNVELIDHKNRTIWMIKEKIKSEI